MAGVVDREQMKHELDVIRAQNPDGVLEVPEAVDWAKANPESMLYRAVDAKSGWDEATMARRGVENVMRDIIREVHLEVVNPEDLAPRRREVELVELQAQDLLVSTYVPPSRLADGKALNGYMRLSHVQQDPARRKDLWEQWRWNQEVLLERYARLGLPEINCEVRRVAKALGLQVPKLWDCDKKAS